MPVSNKKSNKERYAKWRQRQLDDPEKRERQREREKYETKKLKGTVKLVSEMSDRESRYKRKQWRTNQRNKRSKDKYLTTINTPPPTPEGSDAQRQENQNSDERQQVNRNMGR